MSSILPFKRSGQLINNIDEFLDCCGEVALILKSTMLEYFERGPQGQLQDRVEQVRDAERRADELRRSIISAMYTEMLMPDSRGDVLELLDAVDGTLDDTVHLLVDLAIERPDIPDAFLSDGEALLEQVFNALQAALVTARIYFTDPRAVRGEVHKVNFANGEATTIGLKLGRAIYDSELPLERKSQLGNFLANLRALAAGAEDVTDRLSIFAVKRLD